MCELMRSLLARDKFDTQEKITRLRLGRIYNALSNDSPMRICGSTIVPYRGYLYYVQDRRKKLYKWIFKHYGGTRKVIL